MERLAKKSFWIKLFVSYLAVLAFALAIGMFLFRSSLKQIKESTERYSRMSLLQINETISQMMETVQALSDMMSVREEYLSLMYADPELTSYKREGIAKLQKEMKRQVAHNNYVSAMYIWFSHPQLAASTNGMIKSRDSMEQLIDEEFGITVEQLGEWVKDSNGFSIHLLGTEQFATKAIAVAGGNKSYTGDTPIMIMELRLSAWLDILTMGGEPAADQDATFWLRSNDKELYLAPAGAYGLARYAKGVQHLAEKEAVRISYEDKELILMGMERSGDFSIMSAWDYGTYTSTQQRFQRMAVLFLSAYLTLGAVMAMVLTKINYGPVQGLMNLILERVNAVSGNEFAVLETGINSLLKYSQDYEEAKAKEKLRLREKCITALLLGEIEKEEFTQVCGDHGLHFTSDRFLVVGIAIRSEDHLIFDEKAFQKKRESVEVGLFVVNSVAEELLNQWGSAYTCRYEGKIWAVVSPPRQEALDCHGKIMEICRKAEEFLLEQMGISVWIYVSELSKLSQKSSGISVAYQNARWGMEQIESYKIETPVNDYQSVEAFINPSFKEPRNDAGAMRRQLFSAVTAGDFKEADALYLKLRRQDIEFSDSSFATVRAQSLILIGYFVSFLPEEIQKERHEEIKDYLKNIRQERQDEGLIGLMHEWMVYFHGIYQETAKKNGEKEGKNVADDAVQYINSHYSDLNLSVALVAEYLSVSPSYLARSFQKKYGMSVLQYIHCRRIDMAMVLLRESSSTIERIAEEVGYANSLALIRAFKRYKGCTPTEYRNSLKGQEEPITLLQNQS